MSDTNYILEQLRGSKARQAVIFPSKGLKPGKMPLVPECELGNTLKSCLFDEKELTLTPQS